MATEKKFNINRLYVQESSFKIENPPYIFKQLGADVKPELQLELKVKHKPIEDETPNLYEAVLQLKLSAKAKEQTIYNAFVRQAGIFTLEGYNKEELEAILEGYCAEMLYPYARQVLSEQLVQGSFPNLVLIQINFSELHRQRQAQKQAPQAKGETKKAEAIH